MQWVRADSSDFGGTLPQPRSGHTAVVVGKSMVVIFGGLVDKKFLNDVAVYDIENKLWFSPECTGTGHDGQVGPSPRAFHVSASIDCHVFIFGGRLGSKRLGDFWMLDTDIWQWSELTSFGDLPSPRDFAAASAIGNRKIVMYGGWDGKKWLSDVYILDTISLEWMELSISGTLPPPRCGHTATMVEKRLLVFGGRGGGGPIMGDLWALKGLVEEENETPGWTQLKLPGQAPSPRCGHTVTSGGHFLLIFGGHGTGGWLSRYDVYHNDCIVLDRVSVQWKRVPVNNETPPARAYHSVTSIGSRYMLFGGFDGKSTFGDLWWLVPEGDPIAKRETLVNTDLQNKDASLLNVSDQDTAGGKQKEDIFELKKKLGVLDNITPDFATTDEASKKDFIELSSVPARESVFTDDSAIRIQELREHWNNSTSKSLQLRELGPLLRDYQRLIVYHNLENSKFLLQSTEIRNKHYCFYHIKSASQLRMDDIPKLLSEYKELLSS